MASVFPSTKQQFFAGLLVFLESRQVWLRVGSLRFFLSRGHEAVFSKVGKVIGAFFIWDLVLDKVFVNSGLAAIAPVCGSPLVAVARRGEWTDCSEVYRRIVAEVGKALATV